MRLVHRPGNCYELQAVQAGESVLIHLSDGRKITIEQEHADVTISVDFGNSPRAITVYNGEGDEVATLHASDAAVPR